MGYLRTQMRSKFFEELSSEEQKKFFNLKQKSFLHQIDTFYYSVKLFGDDKENDNKYILSLLEYLEEKRELLKLEENREGIWINEDIELKYCFGSFSIYKHRLSINGFVDIFIAESLPNSDTNRINVQLRSIALWELGEKECISRSFTILREFLSNFNIIVDVVTENRIDYCYHTNSIQNARTYFSDSFLEKSLNTSFTRCNKDYDIVKDDELVLHGKRCILKCSYLLIGRRKSDNVVFRTYNKAKEVIEENYKSFFIQRWFDTGVINYYDYLIYTSAFENCRYETIEKDMALFYIEYGKDEKLKEKIKLLLNDPNVPVKEIRKIIKGVVPYPTTVLNFEYQTMRKFYKNGDKLIKSLDFIPHGDDNINNSYLSKLFQIVDNRKIYIDYLTSKTVSFMKLHPVSDNEKDIYYDFWYRLRNTKLKSLSDMSYCREYSRNLDVSIQYNKIDSAVATISVISNSDGDYKEDYDTVIGWLNDNDIKSFKDKNEYYVRLKEKKKKALRSYLNKQQPKDL